MDDSVVMELLGKYDVITKSDLKYEKIRHPVTHRMTSVLNGNRFLYIAPLTNNKSLPRNVYCAGLKCRLFHKGQNRNRPKLQCFNCWGEGHKSTECKQEKKCRVCLQPGHVPGSELCEHFATAKNVIAFKGKENPISNFYPCDLRVFGERHQSAEHAFQLTKAIRAGNTDAAEKVRSAKTALDAKRIGATVRDPEEWATEKLDVMEEIVGSKPEQVPEFRSKLESVGSNAVFAEATLDAHWGTGLDVNATLHTDPSRWPGKNELGNIVKKIASKYTRRVRSASVPRRNTKQDDSQQCMDKFIRDLKRGRSKRPKTSESGDSDLSTHE